MKKGVIVDYQNDNAIVMTKDGRFVKIKTNKDIGEKVNIGMACSSFATLLTVFMLTFFAVGSGLYAGFKIKNTPVSYISVDINPSVEFTTNSQNKVLTVSPANEDAKVILAGEDMIGQDINVAIDRVVSIAAETGYMVLPNKFVDITEDNIQSIFNAVMVTVIGEDEELVEDIKADAEKRINKFFKDNYILGLVLTQDGNYSYREDAMKNCVSIGKMQLIKQLERLVSVEQSKDMPLRDILRLVGDSHKKDFASLDSALYKNQKKHYEEMYKVNFDNYKCNENEPIREILSTHFTASELIFRQFISDDWDEMRDKWNPPCREDCA